MLDTLFQGIFDSSAQTVMAVSDFLLCVGTALVIGLFLAAVYTYKSRYTASFFMTLALLPAVVCVIIMMVNGNIGAGVAVAGAFSLVRFRSVPGTGKDIGSIFLAMGAGLVTGMGYLAYAVLFALIVGSAALVYQAVGSRSQNGLHKTMRITIPEDLDYTHVFDDLLEQYTTAHDLVAVKTTNMGSMFKLTYHITLKDPAQEKAFIDALRCRNGNLEISLSAQEVQADVL